MTFARLRLCAGEVVRQHRGEEAGGADVPVMKIWPISSMSGSGAVMVHPSINGRPGSRSVQARRRSSYCGLDPRAGPVGMNQTARAQTLSSLTRLAAVRSMALSRSSNSTSAPSHAEGGSRRGRASLDRWRPSSTWILGSDKREFSEPRTASRAQCTDGRRTRGHRVSSPDRLGGAVPSGLAGMAQDSRRWPACNVADEG